MNRQAIYWETIFAKAIRQRTDIHKIIYKIFLKMNKKMTNNLTKK